MVLYVARHGQTLWNAQNKVCGVTDIGLNETGIDVYKRQLSHRSVLWQRR